MPDGDNVERTLGRLLAKVESIQDDIKRASESRGMMHRRLDAIMEDVSALKNDMINVKNDLSDTKKVTDEVKRWKLMGIGALGMAGIGGTALGVTIANSLDRLANLFRGH